jgi:DNA-binding transcriptional MerR regulator
MPFRLPVVVFLFILLKRLFICPGQEMKNIQQLSEEIGIGVDTLRVWERRYGFPAPQRDRRGHRSYSQAEVEALRIVKRLQDLGQRPGCIFAVSPEERRQLLTDLVRQQAPDSTALRDLATLMPVAEIAPQLRRLLAEHGLVAFIHETVIPLLQYLGLGWADGSISIAREHFISDRLEEVIGDEVKLRSVDAGIPILFLTLDGERHRLGLLLAAALFQQQGISCQIIHESLPLTEVPQLAKELKVKAVALSFSCHFSATRAKRALVSLRKILDPQVVLIAGGQALVKAPFLPGIHTCTDLKQIPSLCTKVFGMKQKESRRERSGR